MFGPAWDNITGISRSNCLRNNLFRRCSILITELLWIRTHHFTYNLVDLVNFTWISLEFRFVSMSFCKPWQLHHRDILTFGDARHPHDRWLKAKRTLLSTQSRNRVSGEEAMARSFSFQLRSLQSLQRRPSERRGKRRLEISMLPGWSV